MGKRLKQLSGKITEYEIIKKGDINNPKVSVILPVYNVEKYLGECLESLLNQTLKDVEIICIDDGSTDSSFKILTEYAQKDFRLTIISQKNSGAGVARNSGLDVARGEYLLFMDSDDMLEPYALEQLYNKADGNSLDILIFNCSYYDNQTHEKSVTKWTIREDCLPEEEVFSSFDFAKYIYNCSPNWAWNKLFKRSFINYNHLIFQDTSHTNDTYFTCIALALADRISVLNKHLLLYRVNQKYTLTSSGVRNKNPLDILKVLSCIQDKLIEINRYYIFKQSFCNLVLEQLRFNIAVTNGMSRWILLYNIKYFYFKYFKLNDLTQNDLYIPYLFDTLNLIKNFSFFKTVFSVKNVGVHKVICILGIQLKFKMRKLVERERFDILNDKLDLLTKEITNLKKVIVNKECINV